MIIFMLFACGDGKTDSDSDSNSNTDSSYHIQTTDLDILEACETFTDTDGSVYPKEAATAYASGQYTINETELTGTEKIHLIPTAAWANDVSSQPDWEPCEVVWSVVGTEITPTAGNYAISVTGTFMEGASNCPDFVKEAYNQDFSSSYNISLESSGTSVWSYQSSGNTFGEGTHSDTGLTFLSDAVCENLGNVQTQ